MIYLDKDTIQFLLNYIELNYDRLETFYNNLPLQHKKMSFLVFCIAQFTKDNLKHIK
jgi:hypothetical protein